MQTIAYNDIVRMIQIAAAKIRAAEKELSTLDSAIGDGDHGTTICRVMDAAEAAAKGDTSGKIADLLNKVGWDVMSVDGGSTSPLLGLFFIGLSEGAGSAAELNTTAVATMFEAGVAGLRQQTKAQPGDKTMIDALVPAVEALRAAANGGADVSAALRKAADAASRGVQATKDMTAKFGRARNLGDRTRGHTDPGATSISYIFAGFAEAVQ
ncbi:MAG: dihydroxyacetone kinase subunit DhaL [Verrucomicrobia bacterium]|nr:dihydroxyacetone kinase subunit DhaL [Verrucomicrobiota bacterium]